MLHSKVGINHCSSSIVSHVAIHLSCIYTLQLCSAHLQVMPATTDCLAVEKSVTTCPDLLAFTFTHGADQSLSSSRALFIDRLLLLLDKKLHQFNTSMSLRSTERRWRQLRSQQAIQSRQRWHKRSVLPSLPHPVCSISSYEIQTSLIKDIAPVIFPERLVLGYCGGHCKISDMAAEPAAFNMTERHIRAIMVGRGYPNLPLPSCVSEGVETENLMVQEEGAAISYMRVAVSPQRCICL